VHDVASALTNVADANGELQRLALRDRHVALGARLVPFAGWEMPLQYEGIIAEHEAVRTSAGVFDVSHLGRCWLTGTNAAALLRSVTTFNVARMPPGTAHYSLYCNANGGIDDDVFVYHVSLEHWLIVHNAANAEADFRRVAAVAGDAVTEVTATTVMVAVQGPSATGLLSAILGFDVASMAERECREAKWHGGIVLLARTGYTGEDGAECIVDSGQAGGALWDALVAAGARPAGLGARDTLRLEAALPLHGHDIDPSTNPYEAGLGWTVSLGDGMPFPGREALLHLKGEAPARRLAHLSTMERAVPRAGYGVIEPATGTVVGTLTSGAFGPTVRRGIGMAYLPPDLCVPGTSLAIQIRERAVPVEVVPRPFYHRSR